jgi:hypothetical protein
MLVGMGVAGACTGGPGGSGSRGCPAGSDNPAATVSFSRDIVPVLQSAGCMALGCHGGGLLAASGYNLETYRGVFGPGAEAQRLGVCEVTAGDPDNSFLIEKLRANPREGVRMPQGREPLSSEQIATIRTWITEGAANN